jgi:hypothetical protein
MGAVEQLREMLVGFDAVELRKHMENADRLEGVTGEPHYVPLRRAPKQVSTVGWTQEMLSNPLPPAETTEVRPAQLREALGGMATNHDGRLCLLSKYTNTRG